MYYQRPSGPLVGTRRMMPSPPRQILRSPSMQSISPISHAFTQMAPTTPGIQIISKGKGIDDNELNQIQAACLSGVQSGVTPLSRVISEDIKRRLNGEWFVFISNYGEDNFNFSLTRCKGSDFLVLIVGGKKIQVNRLQEDLGVNNRLTALPPQPFLQTPPQPIVQTPPTQPYIQQPLQQQFLNSPQPSINDQLYTQQPEVQTVPYVEQQPYVPDVQSTPYTGEQTFGQQPYVDQQPYIPDVQSNPYIEQQPFTNEQPYVPEVQSTPYLEGQSYDQQALFNNPDVQTTPYTGEHNFEQQNFEPTVETSQYLSGDQSPMRKSVYTPAQTPLVTELGAPLTESVNASYFGPSAAAAAQNNDYKLIARGRGINDNEANQIVSTCCAGYKNNAIPLSRVCSEGIKARLGGEWFVFISQNGLENYNFTMTRCKGSDYMVFVVGDKKFQVCRLRGFS